MNFKLGENLTNDSVTNKWRVNKCAVFHCIMISQINCNSFQRGKTCCCVVMRSNEIVIAEASNNTLYLTALKIKQAAVFSSFNQT